MQTCPATRGSSMLYLSFLIYQISDIVRQKIVLYVIYMIYLSFVITILCNHNVSIFYVGFYFFEPCFIYHNVFPCFSYIYHNVYFLWGARQCHMATYIQYVRIWSISIQISCVLWCQQIDQYVHKFLFISLLSCLPVQPAELS